jgi:hypothetical protein
MKETGAWSYQAEKSVRTVVIYELHLMCLAVQALAFTYTLSLTCKVEIWGAFWGNGTKPDQG